MAGLQPDPSYPPDGISLAPVLTEHAPVIPCKLFWRYKHNAQRAVRDGDLNWLKVKENAFLFGVADPLERASLKDRRPDVYRRLVQEYEAWNSTMLPEDPEASSGGFRADQLADQFGDADK